MCSDITENSQQASDIVASGFDELIHLSRYTGVGALLKRAAEIEAAALNVLRGDDDGYRRAIGVSCDEMRFVVLLLAHEDAEADAVIPSLFKAIDINSSTNEIILSRCALAFSHWLLRKAQSDGAVAVLQSVLPRVRDASLKSQIKSALKALITQ